MTILFREDFEGDGWYDVPVGSGIMKNGWVPWFTEQKVKVDENGDHYGWENLIPEPGHPDENDPHLDVLVHSGIKCLQISLRHATHWAGAYRVFTRAGLSGSQLAFSCYGHTRYHGSGSENPDHPGEIGMKVGIDPTGGTDALADTVIWGPEHPEAVVKGLEKDLWVLFTVTAVAQSDSITVFLHSNPEWAVEFVGPNWDDAMLTMTGAEECWGQPRIQYKRVYNVISSVEEAHRVLDLVGLQTIGPSSDDAGIGMLDDKIAREWNRPQDVQGNYCEFYATNYPRAQPEFQSFGTEEPDLALWSQRDPRWRDHVYGGGMTLGAAGCLITCVAMLTGDEPPETARKLAEAGVMEGAYLSRPALVRDVYPGLVYGGTVHWRNVAADLDMLAGWLQDGPVVIETEFAAGGAIPPTDQHFVIALELDGGDLIIADPWTGEITRLLERYALANWDVARAIYGARLFGHTPAVGKVEPTRLNMVGVHEQRGVPGISEFVSRVPDLIYKTVLSFQNCRTIKGLNKNAITVIRPYPNNVTGKSAVESVINGIADDLATLHPWIDYVELINEQVPSGNDGSIIEAVDTEIWGMHVLKALGYPVMPLILNVAIGNPWGPWPSDPHDQQPLLVKAVQASFDLFGDCTIGYHGYWPSNRTAAYLRFADVNGVRRDVGKYYSFRWQEWDKEFATHGLKPKYINTEMGVIGTHGPRPGDGYIDTLPNDGWRSSNGLGGDVPRLMDELAQWQAECAAWNETHENRMLGGNFFTTGGGSKWSGFEFGDREMRAWAMRLET